MSLVGNPLTVLARSSFLALVIFAAAAYGLTRDGAIAAFHWAMAITIVTWLAGSLLSWRAPRTGWLPPLLCAILLLYGWSVTFLPNLADWMLDQEVPDWLYNLAADYGVYYQELSIPAMIRTTILLGAFLMAIDMFADKAWGRGLLLVLAATAIGMCVVFFVQKLGGESLQLLSLDKRRALSFVTYRYWANGAAFLNLLWPLVAAVALYTGLRRDRGWSLWMGAAILVFSALYFNVSKAGHVLGIIGLLSFVIFASIALARTGWLARGFFSIRTLLIAGVVAAILGVTLFSAISWVRWERLLAKDFDKNVRVAAYGYFLHTAADAGWTGFGPGSFQYAYLPYVQEHPKVRRTPFWVAHQDYLQTVIEWGYLGTILWGLFLIPGAGRLAGRGLLDSAVSNQGNFPYPYTLREKLLEWFTKLPGPGEPLIQCAALTAVLLTALHATVDFPMQIESLQLYFLVWMALGWIPRRYLGTEPPL